MGGSSVEVSVMPKRNNQKCKEKHIYRVIVDDAVVYQGRDAKRAQRAFLNAGFDENATHIYLYADGLLRVHAGPPCVHHWKGNS